MNFEKKDMDMTKIIAKKLTAFLLVFSLILIQFSFSAAAANFPAYAVVSHDNGAPVYPQPGYIDGSGHDGRLDKEKPSKIITTLTKGTKVKALELKADGDGDMWYKINYGDSYEKEGYIFNTRATLVGSYTEDAAFEAWLTQQNFPESYKPKLRDLHSLYPNWVFYADQIDLEWSDVVAAESEVGKKLVHNSKPDSWKSLDPKAYNSETGEWYLFDSGGWVAASKMVVEYYTDPRNFLDSKSIFMFSSHSYDEKYDTKENLMLMINGTFLNATLPSPPDNENMTYADAIMNAAKASNVSPFAIASTILQEQGSAGSGKSISGTEEGYEGYFNFFNVGAYQYGELNAVQNGLAHAKNEGWNTREKSITGGAQWYAKKYVSVGQNTYYYMDFDVIAEGGFYNQQYATSVYDAYGKANFLAKAYGAVMDSSLVFHIPVYKNMPEITRLPEETGNNNNFLESLTVKNHTVIGFNKNDTTKPSELVVRYPVDTIEIVAIASSNLATVEGAGVKQLNVGHNDFEIVVTASSGEKRVYKLSVARLSEDETNALPPIYEPTINGNYKTGEFLTGVGFSISVENFKNKLGVQNGTAGVYDKNGNAKTSGLIGTGDTVKIYDTAGTEKLSYTIVIYGDPSGDGIIDETDLAMVKMVYLGKYQLNGVYYKAGNPSRSGKKIDETDLAMVKMAYLKKYTIEQ
ncbi:MAG: SH3 domain-containing protein [Clostridia bacterium]|nr:SH3 domain-containing protein [Clostridia bacterium]